MNSAAGSLSSRTAWMRAFVTLKEQRSYYLAKRAEHGADTPIGRRCSNAIEQLEQLDTSHKRAVREIAELELAEML
jgi:hypothetical protein